MTPLRHSDTKRHHSNGSLVTVNKQQTERERTS